MLQITVHEEMEATTIDELKEQSWGGAIKRLDKIKELDMEEEFLEYLTNVFDGQVVSRTQVNGFIWFEADEWIEQELENREEGGA